MGGLTLTRQNQIILLVWKPHLPCPNPEFPSGIHFRCTRGGLAAGDPGGAFGTGKAGAGGGSGGVSGSGAVAVGGRTGTRKLSRVLSVMLFERLR